MRAFFASPISDHLPSFFKLEIPVGTPWVFALVCLFVFLAAATLIITRRLSSVIGDGLPHKDSPPLADIMPHGISFAPDRVDGGQQSGVRRLRTTVSGGGVTNEEDQTPGP